MNISPKTRTFVTKKEEKAMISKAKIKWIKSFEQKKHRLEQHLFVAEGPKLVGELLVTSCPVYIAALPEWLQENRQRLVNVREIDEITPEELSRASLLRTPQKVIAVFPFNTSTPHPSLLQDELCLALDGVQDPGNIGTILRIADWFGIRHVVCSHETVDVYNPKAVQATMGALARVQVHYTDLVQFLKSYDAPIYGTFLDGENIYTQELQARGIIVMGNEGNGVSREVDELVNQRLYIPNYPVGSLTTESLNVAVATSIVCAEFRRRQQ